MKKGEKGSGIKRTRQELLKKKKKEKRRERRREEVFKATDEPTTVQRGAETHREGRNKKGQRERERERERGKRRTETK